MDKKYLVRCIEECLECHGTGKVDNWQWQELIAKYHAYLADGGDDGDAEWDRLVKEAWPYGSPPPEVEQCAECEGAGKLNTWIPLQEALEELGIWQTFQEIQDGIDQNDYDWECRADAASY